MALNVVLFVLGAAWLQQQPELPGVFWIYAFLAVLVGWFLMPAVTGPRQRFLRRSGVALLWLVGGFLWAALLAHVKLADHLPPAWEGKDVRVRGVIAALPQVSERGVRFEFDVEQTGTPLARVPRHITLFWYAAGNGAGATPPSVLH